MLLGLATIPRRRRIFRLYAELRVLELQVREKNMADVRDELLTDLDRLERKVRRLRSPINFVHLAYTLRAHINVVRARLQS